MEAKSVDDDQSFTNLLKENSTIHGVRDLLVSPRRDLRFIWVTVLMMTTALTLVGCSQVFKEYMQGKVVVSYSVNEETWLMVPSVIVCPYNRFNRSFLDAHNMSAVLRSMLEATYPGGAKYPYQMRLIGDEDARPKDFDENLAELNHFIARLNMTFDQFFHKSKIDCSAFFSEDDCATVVEMGGVSGRCFRFPPVNQTGGSRGRRIELRLPRALYNPSPLAEPHDGAEFYLAQEGRGVEGDTVAFAAPGTRVTVALRPVWHAFLSDPTKRNPCVARPPASYSRYYCSMDCMLEPAERACNCTTAAFLGHRSNHSRLPVCSPQELFDCYYTHDIHGTEPFEECLAGCPKPCDYWTYDKTISQTRLVAPHYAEIMSAEELAAFEDTIRLEVFYPSLVYTSIEQSKSMTLPSAVAQLGGQLSIYAGASVTSLLQLLLYWAYTTMHGALQRRQVRAAAAKAAAERRWRESEPHLDEEKKELSEEQY